MRRLLGLPLGLQRVGFGPQVGQLLAEVLQPPLLAGVGLLGQRGFLDLEPHAPAG